MPVGAYDVRLLLDRTWQKLTVISAFDPGLTLSERRGGGSLAFSSIVTQAWYALSGDLNMRILFIGDVVGTSGVTVLSEMLPSLRSRWSIDLTVVNGENSAEQRVRHHVRDVSSHQRCWR
jgi:YmdB-like protein